MGQAIPVRTGYTAGEVRRFAKRAKDAAQARRLLAIAAVLDGASREEAAEIGGMDRHTLRDWVIRFNEQGPDGLINIPSPGVPPKLDAVHKAFLARIRFRRLRTCRRIGRCTEAKQHSLEAANEGELANFDKPFCYSPDVPGTAAPKALVWERLSQSMRVHVPPSFVPDQCSPARPRRSWRSRRGPVIREPVE